jgi:hypothetical protein
VDSREIALAQRLQKRSVVPNANNERKKNIMKTSTKTGLSIKTNLKVDGLKVRSAVKAGGLNGINHNRSAR